MDAPGSDLALPPEAGLLIQGCYWPSQQTGAQILAVSDAETEVADHPTASLPSPEATDVTMAQGEASDIVSVSSSAPDQTTLPSSPSRAGSDSPMDEDEDAIAHEVEGESLSNRPSSSQVRKAADSLASEGEEECTALPPCGVDINDDDSSSNISESPIKRRPVAKTGSWRFHSKKLRQSTGQGPAQPLGSIPEEAQRTATLEDLANISDPMQGTPVSSDPATPSYSPFEAQEQEVIATEIDLATEHAEREQGGTAATDLGLAAEQVAMHALYSYQVAAQEATTPGRKGIVQPSIQICSDLPREWPMARLCISYKQVNRYVRTALWRRVPILGASHKNCTTTL